MKRCYALVAIAVLLCAGIARSFACCCEPTYQTMNRSQVIGDTRWILYNGVVYRHTLSTDVATASRQYVQSIAGSRISFNPIDRTSFPSMLRFTSKTTPLVSGQIARVLLDERDRLWAFNDNGDASMFDGVAWETFLHRNRPSSNVDYCGFDSELDVIMHDGVIRIVTSSYVDEIDMNRLARRTLMEIKGTLRNPRFIGMDTIISLGYSNTITIDLGSNTIDIDARRISEEHAQLVSSLSRTIDFKTNGTPLTIKRTSSNDGEFDRRSHAAYWQHAYATAPNSIYTTLHSLNVPTEDTILECGWTPKRTGAYLDMVVDKNGTIYLAGFNGITVIPMTTEEDVTRDRPTPLATATLYPNPATHHVTIGLEAAPAQRVSALIVDASGTTVATTDLRDPNTLFDLTSYPNGMYTVVLTSDRARVARSLIVQR